MWVGASSKGLQCSRSNGALHSPNFILVSEFGSTSIVPKWRCRRINHDWLFILICLNHAGWVSRLPWNEMILSFRFISWLGCWEGLLVNISFSCASKKCEFLSSSLAVLLVFETFLCYEVHCNFWSSGYRLLFCFFVEVDTTLAPRTDYDAASLEYKRCFFGAQAQETRRK